MWYILAESWRSLRPTASGRGNKIASPEGMAGLPLARDFKDEWYDFLRM